jgi:tetratricopeptide (TPR) repeat protein
MAGVAPRLRKWSPIALLATASIGATLGWAGWWMRGSGQLLEQGRQAYSRGDFSQAESLARRKLKTDPHDLEALRLLARSAGRQGGDSLANALFARIGGNALEAEDLFLLGLGLNRAGEPERARQVWLKAQSERPAHPETLEQLVISSTAQNRLAEAAHFAEELSHQRGWELRGELDWGALVSELSDPAAAATILDRALKRPEADSLDRSARARYRKLLARQFLFTGRPGEAAVPLAATLGQEHDAEARWLLSRVALQQGKLSDAAAALKTAGSYRNQHPLEAEPSPFVGESRCTPCHRDIARQSQLSRHTTTLIRGDDLLKLPYPDHAVPDPDDPSVTHAIHWQKEQVRFETRLKDHVQSAIVAYAFGSLDRYFSLVGPDEGGRPFILRLSHYDTGRDAGWVRTTGHTADASGRHDFLGKALDIVDGIQKCLFCHSTDPKAVIDQCGAVANDRAIGCERCHGPGGNHLLAVAARFPDLAIANATEGTAESRVRVCGQCHSFHQELPLARDDPFWIRFQGTTLVWSRCYTESSGSFDCMTCHDPHHDADKSDAHYNERCLSCHSTGRPKQAGSAPRRAGGSTAQTPRFEHPQPLHAAACPVNPSQGCVGCHMPPFYSKPIHATFTDHYIRVRR